MAVTVETSYISETLYPSSHLIPKTFHMGEGGLLHSTFLPVEKLRLQMVVWLTQDYTTEPVVRSRSLPWSLHSILIIKVTHKKA